LQVASARSTFTDNSEEEHRKRNHIKMRKILEEKHAVTHENPLNQEEFNNPIPNQSPNAQNNSFMSQI
jgi:uncharacterized protein VirK/YbjX